MDLPVLAAFPLPLGWCLCFVCHIEDKGSKECYSWDEVRVVLSFGHLFVLFGYINSKH